MSSNNFFSVESCTAISSLKPGAKIHLIGICGVAMGQLAIALQESGFNISGSDKEFYEPMGGLLKSSGVKLFSGYAEENISQDLDLIVIGNAISRTNPEISALEKMTLNYTCFPLALYETVIKGKTSIVVSGTHGKSTTTALLAYTLKEIGSDPSFFIGGVAQNLEHSLQTSEGKFSVVEGDEYDSAFFAKVPKFNFYQPDIFIINAIEFDHADIYSSLEKIDQEFIKELKKFPKHAVVITCSENIHVLEIIKRSETSAKIITFGEEKNSNILISNRKPHNSGQEFTLKSGENSYNCTVQLPGIHNARNFAAAFAVCQHAQLDLTKVVDAFSRFSSVKRRFELRVNKTDLKLVEDFAHHPTAIKFAIQTAKETFPNLKLLAIFEPRSNTSRRAMFHQDYIDAFSLSDEAIITSVISREVDQGVELLNVKKLCDDLTIKGTKSLCLDTVEEVYSYLSNRNNDGYCILVMSNGGFGGLLEKLQTLLLK